MSNRKVVWVLDYQGPAYHDAQPLLATKDIDLIILNKNFESSVASAAVTRLIRDYGEPDLLIAGRDFGDLYTAVTSHLKNKPAVWGDSGSHSEGEESSSPSFQDATGLITRLDAYFFPTNQGSGNCADLKLEPDQSSFTINGQTVRLTPREFHIFNYFLNAPDYTVSRKDFFNNVWNGLKVCNKVLDVHVSNLRKKIQNHGFKIQFVKPGSFEMILPQNFLEPAGSQPAEPENRSPGPALS